MIYGQPADHDATIESGNPKTGEHVVLGRVAAGTVVDKRLVDAMWADHHSGAKPGIWMDGTARPATYQPSTGEI